MVNLADDLKVRFKSLVNERTGLYFKDYALKDLEGAISERMGAKKLDSAVSYYNLLALSEDREDEFRELLNILTIKHTYFFRNEPQFKALKDKILPEIIRRKLRNRTSGADKPSIRIWSAGCSSGEEPYTIAIILRESIPDIENWEVKILATDASEEVLKRARRGVYSENSVKHIPPDYLEKYFEISAHAGRAAHYTLNDTVRKMVDFAYFNLMDADYPMALDVIFCRNVTIYFELDTTVKVMTRIQASLNDDGYLFIGYAETLQYLPDKFTMEIEGEAIYYRKAGMTAAPFAPRQKEEAPDLDSILEELSRKQAAAELEAELAKPKAFKNIEEMLAEAIKMTRLKDYNKALELANEANRLDKKAFDPYYMAAEIMMNQGKFDGAKRKLDDALKISPLFAPAHYLLGCIYLEEGTSDRAKEALRKALYINKDFSLAHFYLANVYRNEGRADDAIREYRNTMKLLSGSKTDDIIAYSGGFNASTIINVCRDNLERLKVAG